MDFLFVVAGFIMLIAGGDWLLKSAVGFSLRLNIPKIVIGMTVVSFATSAPELIVSIKAALNGHSDIALGNVIGSNIANLGLVLGITVMLSTIKVEKAFYKTDWPVMMLASVLLYFFIAFDGEIQQYEGIVLFALLVLFIVYLLKFNKTSTPDEIPENDKAAPLFKDLIYMTAGAVALWGGSELLISGAVNMAEYYGVSQRIIGVSIISIGTSIPELAASVIAVIKKEKAISLGNLLGSNVFNILAVLGLTSMIKPVKAIDDGLITNDIYWMLLVAVIVLPLIFIPAKMKLTWRSGLILLGGYIVFMYNMIG